ncbi:MAG: hypothetical protein CMJ64_26055 [Planctomycetaceae bacterium]|nr:hypothetical protein [Planctomycetaceae bacterium]
MKKASIIIAVVAVAFVVSSEAFSQTNDHFARQRREAAAKREAAERATSVRHWGGPTTNHRWYPNNGSRQNGTTVIRQQNVQFVPVSPFGFGFPTYSFPRYNDPRWGYGGGWNPRYGYPRYGSPFGQHIHIHHEIIKQ